MSSEFVETMKWYTMITPEIQAVEIDASWVAYLTKEKGYRTAHIGDYYILGLDGPQIMSKAYFNRLFRLSDVQ